MKPFIISWFYKTFIPSNILAIIFHICMYDDILSFFIALADGNLVLDLDKCYWVKLQLLI